jgi:Putative regulator of cell autolysis
MALFNTVRFKLVIEILLIVLFFIILLVYGVFYAMDVVRDQVAISNKGLLALHNNQIGDSLTDVEKYLVNFRMYNTDISEVRHSSDTNNCELAKIRLFNKMSSDLPLYKSVDSFFIYFSNKNLYLSAIDTDISFPEFDRVKAAIQIEIEDRFSKQDILPIKWHYKEIGDVYYFYFLVKSDNVYMGAWVNTQKLIKPLDKASEPGESSKSLFVTQDGTPMNERDFINKNKVYLSNNLGNTYVSGKGSKYLVIREKANVGDFYIANIIPESIMFKNIFYFRNLLIVIFISSIMIIPLSLILIRKLVLTPIKQIVKAMKLVRDGDLNIQIQPNRASEEFVLVADNFNNMINQIKKLKIDVLEEQVKKQKEELFHLQLQIKPHFFMNSLNIIYSLAQTKNYALIQEMTLCLVNYYKYVTLTSNSEFVLLKAELEHVKNYLKIQKLRFSSFFNYELIAEDSVLSRKVPPFIVQTFVENILKHALDMESPLSISINIFHKESQDFKGLHIEIRDSGKGFKVDILKQLENGEIIKDMYGEHIGIWNIQRRLKILYSGKAYIEFGNLKPQGASVNILLPYSEPAQEVHENA